MLRLPRPDEETAPLVTAASMPEPPAPEEAGAADPADAAPAQSLVPLMLGMAVPGAILLVAAWFWLKPDTGKSDPAPLPPPLVEAPAKEAAPAVAAATEMPEGVELLRQVEPVVKAFMEAGTMEEALRFVHDPEVAGERWKKWLGDTPYEAPGFRRVAEESLSIANETLVSLTALNADFEQQAFALRFADGAFLVDWESSAGWSEMTLEEFRREKPSEPKLFRVILSNVDYFNFGFSDELEWASFRLDSPDGEQSIYGYVKRAGELDAKIRPAEEKERVPIMLRLRFPDDAPSDNQVLIEEQIGTGWVDHTPSP